MDQLRHHYSYIRKIWLNPNECAGGNPSDTLDQLNKKVVIIKNNLFSLSDIERKSYSNTHNDDQYESVQKRINEMVHQLPEYNLLKEKY